MPSPIPSSKSSRSGTRRQVFLGLVATVFVAHVGWLYDAGTAAPETAVAGEDVAGSRVVPLRVRLIEAVPSPVAPSGNEEGAGAATPPAAKKAGAARLVAAPLLRPHRPRPAHLHADEPRSGPEPAVLIDPTTSGTDIVAVADQAAGEPADAAASAAAEPPPVTYATRIPHPFVFRYALQRGNIGGDGEIAWKRDGDRYEATMRGSVAGISLLGWTSTGKIDKTGLAPDRYVDHRFRKPDQAASFQRSESKITFSGSSKEYPVVPGAQDRLSWMIQLPAILGADATKARAGSRIAIFVVGAHGDAETWVFQSAGAESVDVPAGTTKAVKFMREPRQAFDTKVEVWLDPARQYLPVRARMSSSPTDTPFELQLSDAGS